MREANKIVSLKEDTDIVSWERVLQIGVELQGLSKGSECEALGVELVDLAHASIALYSRFGIEPTSSARLMPSGIEVLEGGLAEAALEEQQAAKAEERAEEGGSGDTARSEITVPVHHEHLFSKTRSIESFRSDKSWDELLGPSVSDEAGESEKTEAPEKPEAPAAGPAADEASFEPEEPSLPADIELASPPEQPPAADAQARPEPEPESERPAPQQDEGEPVPASATERPSRERFARFHTLYESRDHSLCVFEDEHGHLVAVDASKLA